MRSRHAARRRAASTSHSDSMTRIAAISAAAIGLAMASASRPPVAISSAVETAMLLNGSGLALTSVRAPALPAWATNAAPPPSRKLAICQAGSPASTIARLSRAPPSGRTNEWIASHALSTQAILSAKNSAKRADRGDADHPIVGEHVERLQLVGQGDPAELHRQAGDQGDEIQPPAGEQAGRGGERDQFDGVMAAKPSAA